MNAELPKGLIEALARGRRVVVSAAAPDKGMRTLGALCAFTVLCAPRALGQAMPAYRFVEGLSDRAYNFARADIIGPVLPVGLSRAFAAAPASDGAQVFERRLEEDERAFLLRADGSRAAREGRPRQWRAWAVREQAGILSDAAGRTMRERYRIDLFSRFLEQARQGGLREPGTLALAGAAGGAFVYVDGVHRDFTFGRLRVGLNVRPGFKLERAVRTGAGEHLADLRVGLKDRHVSVSAQYGLRAGRAQAERVGLDYNLRF